MKVYNDIKKERMRSFGIGMVLGVTVASGFIREKGGENACVFMAVTLIIACTFYMLMPKKMWMLQVLSSEEQIESWLRAYNNMKTLTVVLYALSTVYLVIEK